MLKFHRMLLNCLYYRKFRSGRIYYTTRNRILIVLGCLASWGAVAGPVQQPPGSNLTFGDVAHGLRVQSATGNPAAAAADRARLQGRSAGGVSISGAAGLEYGNVQDLFDFVDELARAYEPSEPGTGGGPGQEPDTRPESGIDIGAFIDELDPEVAQAIEAIGEELVSQAALLALIASEGYGKAWVSADVPFVWNSNWLGGTWTTGISWSGASKAYGLTAPIEFDADAARVALENWIDDTFGELTGEVALSEQVLVRADPETRNIIVTLNNDSSLLTKASQLTEISVGYSRESLSSVSGRLYLGLEAKLYLMRLSRFSARFGDITDSKELFDAIDNASFNNDEDFGVDIGALWVGENYQLGVQWTNINQPDFLYPEVDIAPYSNPAVIEAIQRDQTYTMDSQVKLEASLFSSDRRWSAHLGYDVDSAKDPFGDEFQWLTLSASLARDSFWLPNLRIGYRQNLAGTELGYVSLGLTAFKYVNFDLSSALDTVEISGTELPQGLMGSIGFQISW